jgi:hypothetical protein
MKARVILVPALLLVLLLAGSVPAAAGGVTRVPFLAFYSMQPVVVGVDENGCNIQQLPGEGRATHLGKSAWYSDAVACLDPATMEGVQFGTSIFTDADDGAQLIGAFSGVAKIVYGPAGPQAEFSGTYRVTEGTGRLLGYTGTGRYWGTAWLAEGTGELYFEGTLTRP